LSQIALVGNPNTGKSALFNRLTGARQRVGNYPGLTIEKKLGLMRLDDRDVEVLDLPGLYSMAALTADERVVLDVMTGHMRGTRRPDLVVCVLDASNLRRNLFLTTQLAEVGLPMVIALNMWDEAETRRLRVDVSELGQRLGVPVVPTIASRGIGVDRLKQVIARALTQRPTMRRVDWPTPVDEALQDLRAALEVPGQRSLTDVELRRLLLDVDSSLADDLAIPLDERERRIDLARERVRSAGYEPAHLEAAVRYAWLDRLLDRLAESGAARRRRFSESIDDLLTHRVAGPLVFVAIMYVMFQSIYTLATPFMDAIEALFATAGAWVGAGLGSTPVLRSLVVDGLIAGVGGVLVFLPQIAILFLFIALLEDAGYMPRAAFLMDRLFGWCGLSGKSFVPLLSSYACAVPGIMATRTIQEPKARLTTILVCPLMSCSARLPVYVLLIGAFIEPVYGATLAGLTLFAMHFVGLAVAIPVAFVLNRIVLRGRRTPFLLEMPPYRVPQLRDIGWRVFGRAREFVVRAGTVILAMSIVIWALCYFPRSDVVREGVLERQGIAQTIPRDAVAAVVPPETSRAIEAAYLEQSYMGRFGQAVQPLFAPAGFDWKITVGVLASFPAREVIISTLGILYNLGAEVDEQSTGLAAALQGARRPDGHSVFSPIVAIAIMVFFALCSQCMATLVTIAREASWRWAAFSFAYMTVLAWAGAVVVYQVGTAIFGAS